MRTISLRCSAKASAEAVLDTDAGLLVYALETMGAADDAAFFPGLSFCCFFPVKNRNLFLMYATSRKTQLREVLCGAVGTARSITDKSSSGVPGVFGAPD